MKVGGKGGGGGGSAIIRHIAAQKDHTLEKKKRKKERKKEKTALRKKIHIYVTKEGGKDILKAGNQNDIFVCMHLFSYKQSRIY